MLVRKHHGFKKLFDFDGPQCILICSRIFALCVSFFPPFPQTLFWDLLPSQIIHSTKKKLLTDLVGTCVCVTAA